MLDETCAGKFDNILNFRGFNKMQGKSPFDGDQVWWGRPWTRSQSISSFWLRRSSYPEPWRRSRKKPKPTAFEDIDFPRCDEGDELAAVFGQCWRKSWMVLTVGNYRTKAIKTKGSKK
ncbi:hypothetical protein P4054_29725 [Pseudomonas aeruginosa]|nr:hypothetical protein [Pseudomonas aeruginosa]